MTKHPDLFADLAATFDAAHVKTRTDRWKDKQTGEQREKNYSYVTARTVMNRLDNVLGPENWWDRYVPGENSVLCELTIRLPDGSTLTKCDAGGYAGMADSGDDDKSGYSDSFKRAAVKFGVGRYLYRDGVPSFAVDSGQQESGQKDRSSLTTGHSPLTTAKNGPTGQALYDFAMRSGNGLLRHLTGWGRERGYPGRVIEWDCEQYKTGFDEANRYLSQRQHSTNGATR